ncbi:pilin [Undibacterium sp. CY18W]|uniref:Pilin n=1 Tax=Undibacterium hunanense TaxID=2762292 RepID=A0ABR6ZUZ9_9BURK|nr:pilin [Undibacterium hunanense]MBC3919683.1 pilin [Undibacterium hunanense]
MKKQRGFTLLEMMLVIVVIATLAALAIPSYLYKIVREQIEAAIPLADIAKKPVAATWLAEQKFPADNAAAGLPMADKIVSNLVSSVAVKDGAIHITFGNNAHSAIRGKILSLRPAVVEDAPVVPVAWVCAAASVPDKMTVKGVDRTTIPAVNLPLNCRAKLSK